VKGERGMREGEGGYVGGSGRGGVVGGSEWWQGGSRELGEWVR